MAYLRGVMGSGGGLGCPGCSSCACGKRAELGETYEVDDGDEPAPPAAARSRRRGEGLSGWGLGEDVTATMPDGRSCSASERRILRPVEPAAADLLPVPAGALAPGAGPVRLERTALTAYMAMRVAARADGIADPLLNAISGYRSVARQERLWRAALARYGSTAAARRWVAPPGASPHHSGRAIDLWLGLRNDSRNVAALRRTAAYAWLVCNAARFGFFPYANEPWHWEYNPPPPATP